MKTKVVMAWSGGKGGAMALWRLQRDEQYEVVGLLTTLTHRYNRVSSHGVRRLLLQAQAESLGLTLHEVWLPLDCTGRTYETAMGRMMAILRAQGVSAVAFGDLSLEDVRAYREKMLSAVGMQALFPIWGEHTGNLARTFIAEGFHATLVCVDPGKLEGDFLGHRYDSMFLESLPKGVDPCGENGEFHTFVHEAPNFRTPIPTTLGVRIVREDFHYVDLQPLVVKAQSQAGADPVEGS